MAAWCYGDKSKQWHTTWIKANALHRGFMEPNPQANFKSSSGISTWQPPNHTNLDGDRWLCWASHGGVQT